MPKANYAFAKRQRDMPRNRKKNRSGNGRLEQVTTPPKSVRRSRRAMRIRSPEPQAPLAAGDTTALAV